MIMRFSKLQRVKLRVRLFLMASIALFIVIYYTASAFASVVDLSSGAVGDYTAPPDAVYEGVPTLEKARQLISEGSHEKAAAVLKSYIQKNPNSEKVPELMLEIGKCQRETLEKNKLLMTDNIIKSYEEMVNRFPQSDFAPQAYYQIGQLYEKELKEYREAIKSYEKCAYEYPATSYAASAYFRIGQIYENNLNDYEGAILTYTRLARDFYRCQIAVDARLRIEQIYETKLKDVNKTLEAYAEIVNNYPENKKMPEILMNMAKFYMEKNDTENAIKTYQQIIERFPKEKNAIESYKKIADIYEENRDYKNLADTYVKMSEAYPTYEKNDYITYQIGQIYEINMREYKKKRVGKNENIVMEDGSDGGKTYYKLDKKNLETAIKYYTKVVDTYPQSPLAPSALLKIGNILNNDLYRGIDAKLMYKAVVEKYPQSKEYAQASEIFEKVR